MLGRGPPRRVPPSPCSRQQPPPPRPLPQLSPCAAPGPPPAAAAGWPPLQPHSERPQHLPLRGAQWQRPRSPPPRRSSRCRSAWLPGGRRGRPWAARHSPLGLGCARRRGTGPPPFAPAARRSRRTSLSQPGANPQTHHVSPPSSRCSPASRSAPPSHPSRDSLAGFLSWASWSLAASTSSGLSFWPCLWPTTTLARHAEPSSGLSCRSLWHRVRFSSRETGGRRPSQATGIVLTSPSTRLSCGPRRLLGVAGACWTSAATASGRRAAGRRRRHRHCRDRYPPPRGSGSSALGSHRRPPSRCATSRPLPCGSSSRTCSARAPPARSSLLAPAARPSVELRDPCGRLSSRGDARDPSPSALEPRCGPGLRHRLAAGSCPLRLVDSCSDCATCPPWAGCSSRGRRPASCGRSAPVGPASERPRRHCAHRCRFHAPKSLER